MENVSEMLGALYVNTMYVFFFKKFADSSYGNLRHWTAIKGFLDILRTPHAAKSDRLIR